MNRDAQSGGAGAVDTVFWRLLTVLGCLVLGGWQAWAGVGALFVLSAHASVAEWAAALSFLVALPCALLVYPFPRATAAVLLAAVFIGLVAVLFIGGGSITVWAIMQAPIQLLLASLAWRGRRR